MAPGEIPLATLALGQRRVWPRREDRWRLNWDHAERLRERQEAAGRGLKNLTERGGCLLFARRNGSAFLSASSDSKKRVLFRSSGLIDRLKNPYHSAASELGWKP